VATSAESSAIWLRLPSSYDPFLNFTAKSIAGAFVELTLLLDVVAWLQGADLFNDLVDRDAF
jgi:hypothetical protein